MPTVDALQTSHQRIIAPNDDDEFLRLLTEADLRLLEMARWRWCRGRLSLTQSSNLVTLPADYAAILAARVDTFPVDIKDEEYEFVPDGVGEIEVPGGGSMRLIDQGLDGSDLRTYKVVGQSSDAETIYTIALYAPYTLYYASTLPAVPGVTESVETRCPSSAALKNAMFGILFEEAHDVGSSHAYMSTAVSILNNRGKSRRGGAQTNANVRPYGPGVSPIRSHR